MMNDESGMMNGATGDVPGSIHHSSFIIHHRDGSI
jgi:hypothetical protein